MKTLRSLLGPARKSTHLQVLVGMEIRAGPNRERCVFILLLWSVIDVRNMWVVSVQGSTPLY
jgi:hypothetical protein